MAKKRRVTSLKDVRTHEVSLVESRCKSKTPVSDYESGTR